MIEIQGCLSYTLDDARMPNRQGMPYRHFIRFQLTGLLSVYE